jgi:hypothetical protein
MPIRIDLETKTVHLDDAEGPGVAVRLEEAMAAAEFLERDPDWCWRELELEAATATVSDVARAFRHQVDRPGQYGGRYRRLDAARAVCLMKLARGERPGS